MNVKVAKEHSMGDKELRKEFCETLISMAEQDECGGNKAVPGSISGKNL